MIRCFSFGFSNIHGASMDAIPEKIMIPVKMDALQKEPKMTIDFKGVFKVKIAHN
jgi:hypothetical protein